MPSALEILESWMKILPIGLDEVFEDAVRYTTSSGETKELGLKDIQRRIQRMTVRSKQSS